LNRCDPVEVARPLLAHGADPNAGYMPDGEPPPVTVLSTVLHGRLDPVNQAAAPGRGSTRPAAAKRRRPERRAYRRQRRRYPHNDAALALLLAAGLGHNVAPGLWRQRLDDLRSQRRDGDRRRRRWAVARAG
jgi:hypothetical protein